MKTIRRASWVCVVTLLALPTAVGAQPKVDFGKVEYLSNCAACHGLRGDGNGSVAADLLKRSPSNLTTMQKRNGGIFPLARTYEIIEGVGVPEHGTRDMPVWGRAYAMRAAEHYVDVPYSQEAYVRARILALVEYLSRIQVK